MDDDDIVVVVPGQMTSGPLKAIIGNGEVVISISVTQPASLIIEIITVPSA